MWRTAGNYETQTEETEANNLQRSKKITVGLVNTVIKAQKPEITLNGEDINPSSGTKPGK